MARQSVRDDRAALGLRSLPASHWKQFRDVRRPGRPDAKIDHVLVGPSGIHVIGYLPPTSDPTDPTVSACSDSASAVAAVLPARYRARVRAMACLRNEEPVAEEVGEVMVTSFMAVDHILRESPVVLSTSEVSEVSTRLGRTLEPYPVQDDQSGGRGPWPRRLLAAAAAVAVAVGAATLGPELVEVARVW